MQMLVTKLIKKYFICLIVYISSTNLCSAEILFIDFFQTDPIIDKTIADRITSYYAEEISLPMEKQKSELFELESELDKLHETYSNQAVYWFLQGLNHRNLASYYFEANKPKLADSHIYSKDTAYKKAIELDKESLKSLSASIYNTMKFGLPPELKIEATQKELSLGGNGDNESSYWYLHWSNIDQLKKAGRDKEAEQAYKNMTKEMNEDDTDMSVYGSLNQAIEKVTLNKTEKNPEQPSIETIRKNESQPIEKNTREKPVDKRFFVISLIVTLSLISLLAITIYEMKIKKRKSK